MKQNRQSLSAALSRPVIAEVQPRHFCCSIWHNISILIWADRATHEALGRIQRVTKQLIGQYPNGHSNVAFVLTGVQPPTPEAREILTHLYKDGVGDLKCVGVVLEGEGFWASMLRSSVTNMQIESGRRTALGQYRTIEEMADWMAPLHSERTGIAMTSQALRVALRNARSVGVPDTADSRA